MAQGSDTISQYGSRFSVPTYASYNPLSYGSQTTGVPNVSPTLPPFLGGSAAGAGAAGIPGEQVGGYGTAGNNAVVTAMAAENPHNLRLSPTWWVVIFLLLGLVLLKVVAWRETIEEGVDLGPARERAEEEA